MPRPLNRSTAGINIILGVGRVLGKVGALHSITKKTRVGRRRYSSIVWHPLDLRHIPLCYVTTHPQPRESQSQQQF